MESSKAKTRLSAGDIERSARAEVNSRSICSDRKEASCVTWMIHVQVLLEVRDSAACLRGLLRPKHGVVYTQKRRQVIMVCGVVNAVPNRVPGEH